MKVVIYREGLLLSPYNVLLSYCTGCSEDFMSLKLLPTTLKN
jgi:hypothetical protein